MKINQYINIEQEPFKRNEKRKIEERRREKREERRRSGRRREILWGIAFGDLATGHDYSRQLTLNSAKGKHFLELTT